MWVSSEVYDMVIKQPYICEIVVGTVVSRLAIEKRRCIHPYSSRGRRFRDTYTPCNGDMKNDYFSVSRIYIITHCHFSVILISVSGKLRMC